MPCLTARFDLSIGPILSVGIHSPGTVDLANLQRTPPPLFFSALIDTGAKTTCISGMLAKSLGLLPAGMRPMGSATQQAIPTNTYTADLGILFSGIFWFPEIRLWEFTPPPDSPYQLLLGGDILYKGILTISLDGHFSFSI